MSYTIALTWLEAFLDAATVYRRVHSSDFGSLQRL